MPCFHPLKGWKSRTVGASGKRAITFKPRDAFIDLPMEVPCGQCTGCRLERSRQWAVRCLHEASLHSENCFITLTYSTGYLPPSPGGLATLDRRAFPLFMKRLRKAYAPRRIRYYHCGEYGELHGRPHYHACLFGFDFPDKLYAFHRGAFPVWRSPGLALAWPFGHSEVGSVTFESAAYVARYIMKKITGDRAESHYQGRVPEYTTMSRRPGIGSLWLQKYLSEVYPSDEVIMRGRAMKPPRYYDLQLEAVNPGDALEVARKRRRARRLEDQTPDRLAVREAVVEASLARLPRPLEV